MPLGNSLNNPGNIEKSSVTYKGEITPSANNTFKQFSSMAYGFRALYSLLYHYINSSGLNTISKILTVYAPASDGNNPVGYTNYVSSQSGIQADYVLSKDDFTSFFGDPNILKIVRAIARMEQGVAADEGALSDGLNMFNTDQGLA